MGLYRVCTMDGLTGEKLNQMRINHWEKAEQNDWQGMHCCLTLKSKLQVVSVNNWTQPYSNYNNRSFLFFYIESLKNKYCY